jgi:DNA-binding IclR family transcriptional regulator
MSRESPPTRRVAALLEAVVRRPEHDYSLAELARDTGISKATCLGIVNTLSDAGWLTRDPDAKTYRPGVAMLAAGAAAQAGRVAVPAARPHLGILARDFRATCTASAVVDGAVTVLARKDPNGPPTAAFRVGQRYPFAPPSGVMFVAWDDDATVETWLASEPLAPLRSEPAQLRAVVAACREHGYLVVGLGDGDPGLQALLARLDDDELAGRLGELLRSAVPGDVQPYLTGELDPSRGYDVSLVCAPTFDADGRMELLLAVLLMRSAVPGREVRRAAGAVRRAADAVSAQVGGYDPWSSPPRRRSTSRTT